MLAPDGELIGKIGYKRTQWYLRKNLAILISENPTIIQLKFEPKGRGSVGDLFYLSNRENKCVVCGCEDKNNLTKHHIIPYCFRRCLPDFIKRHTSHDIIMLCEKCHNKYERFATQRKHELADQYKVSRTVIRFVDKKLLKAKKYATILLKNEVFDISDNMYLYLMKFTNRNIISKKHLVKMSVTNPYKIRIYGISYAKEIVKKIEDLDVFIVDWRKHFINTMNPRFMPKFWDVNKRC